MKQKTIELFGIDILNETTQKKAITAFDNLLSETGSLINSKHMFKFFESLGADKLPEEIQNDLRERTIMVIEYERGNGKIPKSIFKWNSISEGNETINEIKKNNFKWDYGLVANESIKTKGSFNKISKKQFRWPKDIEGVGSHIDEASAAGASSMFFGAWHRAAKIVYVDSVNKKILYSVNPNFQMGATFDETLAKAAGDQGYSIMPVDTSKYGWKEQMMKRANGRI